MTAIDIATRCLAFDGEQYIREVNGAPQAAEVGSLMEVTLNGVTRSMRVMGCEPSITGAPTWKLQLQPAEWKPAVKTEW